MQYLLDTHAILWYVDANANLPLSLRDTIDSSDCFYSVASLWEIAIKQSLGKLKYKCSVLEIAEMCRQEHFLRIPVTEKHIERIKTLDFIHRDPFDRLLIAIAQTEDLTIITRDTIIPKYDVKTLW